MRQAILPRSWFCKHCAVFTSSDRDGAREFVLEMSTRDPRIVGCAEIGGLVEGGDRWSDLDLTFAVGGSAEVADVLEDWTSELVSTLKAARLFDLPSGSTIYRVFLLPNCLQIDLSFTPECDFGGRGPKFRLLFGRANEIPHASPPSSRELFGVGVHHAVRARICIERGRFWQAEYWISATRDCALALACRRRGLDVSHGRGFDDLPAEVLADVGSGLVVSLDRTDLVNALAVCIRALLNEATELPDIAAQLQPQLVALTSEAPTD